MLLSEQDILATCDAIEREDQARREAAKAQGGSEWAATRARMKRWTPLRPIPVQQAYYSDSRRFVMAIAGRRSGKTDIAKRRKVKKWVAYRGETIDPLVIFGAPTWRQAKKIFWRDLKMLTPKAAIDDISEGDLTISLINGVRFSVVGLDAPERIEGVPIDDGVLDEYGNMKPEAWTYNIQPSLSTPGREPGCMDFIGVPEGMNHYNELRLSAIGDPTGEWGVHHWSAEIVLAESEVKSLKSRMDPRTYEQEIHGKFVTHSGRAYYTFEVGKNTDKRHIYDKKADLLIGFDFNREPGVAVICQRVGKDFFFIGEVHIPVNSNTLKVCDKLVEDWGTHSGNVFVYGDATGGAGGSAKVQGSDWDLVKSKLRPAFGERLFMRVPDANPRERVRVVAMNSIFEAADGTVSGYVDPGRCPNLVKDLLGTVVLEGGTGEIDKDATPLLTHLSDAAGYIVWKVNKALTSSVEYL